MMRCSCLSLSRTRVCRGGRWSVPSWAWHGARPRVLSWKILQNLSSHAPRNPTSYGLARLELSTRPDDADARRGTTLDGRHPVGSPKSAAVCLWLLRRKQARFSMKVSRGLVLSLRIEQRRGLAEEHRVERVAWTTRRAAARSRWLGGGVSRARSTLDAEADHAARRSE